MMKILGGIIGVILGGITFAVGSKWIGFEITGEGALIFMLLAGLTGAVIFSD